MKYLLLLSVLLFSFATWGQSSMRRCTLLPITDSVGGAIGFKVFQEVEEGLKSSNWCTYVSNSGMINVFSRYRENLPQYLRTKEVLTTVSEKLNVGSLLLVTVKSEIDGYDLRLTVYGENGEDIYFNENMLVKTQDTSKIASAVTDWLEMYAKTIPYDAKINGVLGDQITLDVGKSHVVTLGQQFIVKRPIKMKKHPLLKEVVDWDSETLATGKVFSVSDNQALGMIQAYTSNKKVQAGDWIRLETAKVEVLDDPTLGEEKETPGTLGVISVNLFGSSHNTRITKGSKSKRMHGTLLGVDLRGEAWITRQYFAALEVERSLGNLKKASGDSEKSSVGAGTGVFKLTGGYRYLPIGFFYGPQIDLYGGYANFTYDLDVSKVDGFGKNSFTGILLGTKANIPINREYRVFAKGEFMPFPSFHESDKIYGSAKSVSSLDLEIGVNYQYTPRMSFDGSFETMSRKAKFNGEFKEVSYKDNRLKFGLSFNF